MLAIQLPEEIENRLDAFAWRNMSSITHASEAMIEYLDGGLKRL